MAYNYESPKVEVIHPSGSQSSPTTYYLDSLTLHPVIQWSYNDPENNELSHIQVQVYDDHSLVWDSKGVKLPQDTDHALLGSGLLYLLSLRHFELPSHDVLPFNKTYSVRVRAMDTQEDPRWQKWGEWSDLKYFKVVLSPMSLFIKFNVDVFADNKEEKIILSWTDNAQEMGTLSGYNILRSEHPDGEYDIINGSLITSRQYEDYSADHGIRYYYKIEAVMEDGSSALSPYTQGSVIVQYWSIGSFKFVGATSFQKKRDRAQSKRATLGKRRVIQDRGFLPEDLELEIYLLNDQYSTGEQKYNELMKELEKLAPLVIRDPFGRSWTVAAGSFEDQQLPTGNLEYVVKFDLSEVDG